MLIRCLGSFLIGVTLAANATNPIVVSVLLIMFVVVFLEYPNEPR